MSVNFSACTDHILTNVGTEAGLTTPYILMTLGWLRSHIAFSLSIISSESDSFFVNDPVGSSRAATITCPYTSAVLIQTNSCLKILTVYTYNGIDFQSNADHSRMCVHKPWLHVKHYAKKNIIQHCIMLR